jgi:hypothetical protein
METPIISYCGLNCSACPAYIATQAQDQDALERVAAQWREEYGNPSFTVETVRCDGCLSGEYKCSQCARCTTRACGIAHGVANCAHCDNYTTCEDIQGFIAMVPDARANLEAIRLSL